MPEYLRNFQFTPLNILKAAGVVLIVIVVIAFGLGIIGSSVGSVRDVVMQGGGGMGFNAVLPSMGMPGKPAYDYSEEAYYADEDVSYGRAELSARNVAGIAPMPPTYPPGPGGTTGNTAEQFEVTQYSGTIETREKEETCKEIADLKGHEYVIFENANDYDRGCDFTFKVEHSRVEEILAFIREFDPKTLHENTHTIKNQVDDFTSETDILTKKRASIDQTLQSALLAYDEITRLATANQNADALAKIIDSKIQLIERLTQERININEQLDRLSRAKAEQLDQLDYTYFSISVYENKFVDGERIWDSWKNSVRATINEVNTVLQEVTLGLVALLFLAAQWILYILILVFIAKYLWKTVKYIWEK